MSMREKIAMRLVTLYSDNDGPLDGLTEADAVLDALMEPTEGMIEHGAVEYCGATKEQALEWAKADKFESHEYTCGDIFRAMIQAAKDGK